MSAQAPFTKTITFEDESGKRHSWHTNVPQLVDLFRNPEWVKANSITLISIDNWKPDPTIP